PTGSLIPSCWPLHPRGTGAGEIGRTITFAPVHPTGPSAAPDGRLGSPVAGVARLECPGYRCPALSAGAAAMVGFGWRASKDRARGSDWRSRWRSAAARCRRALVPRLEGLEVRIPPATATWTGAGTDSNWMTAAN